MGPPLKDAFRAGTDVFLGSGPNSSDFIGWLA